MENNHEDLEKLVGSIKRVTYHSPESGYSILKIIPEIGYGSEEIAVTVYHTAMFMGATVEFYGSWIHHPKYGLQFTAKHCYLQKPDTVKALEKYIGSGLIKGVGPGIAKRIVKHFGKDTLDIFDNEIDQLDQVKGITKAKITTIKICWIEHQQIRKVMMFLQEYGISTLFAVKIYKFYGDKAIKLLTENPYRLATDIYGIGFLSADKVALKMGMVSNGLARIVAGIDFILQNARDDGHCYLNQYQITTQSVKILNGTYLKYLQEKFAQKPKVNNDNISVNAENKIIDEVEIPDFEMVSANQIPDGLEQMEKKDQLKTRIIEKETLDEFGESTLILMKCYYAKSIYWDEEAIFEKVIEMAGFSGKNTKSWKIKTKGDLKKWLELQESANNIKLSPQQLESVINISFSPLSILTGGPGCGKTTTTKLIVLAGIEMGKKITLAAPTGRAAQRMMEVIGIDSKTIHRLLEFDPKEGGFKINKDNYLKTDFLIVDETSMLDVHLASAIFKCLKPGTQLLLIGDTDQLPSVGAGNVLKDLIGSGKITVCRLTQVFRQSQNSSIIQFAHQINRGVFPKIPTPFQNPELWKNVDTLFLDSEEATLEQLTFIRRAKNHLNIENKLPVLNTNQIEESLSDPDLMGGFESVFKIPKKFEHVNLQELDSAVNSTDELKSVLNKIHPYSTLNYGLDATATLEKIYKETIPKYFPGAEIQILSPMTKGSLGTGRLNIIIQELINPKNNYGGEIQFGSKIFRVNDRIIQKVNNYNLNVFNGDIGKILGINKEEQLITVEFKLGADFRLVEYDKSCFPEIDLAYAITIHKSQGSEFDIVIIPITTQHFQMLYRNLIYTGLTRAKKLVVFLGSRRALSMAINNVNTGKRQTGLPYLFDKRK